LELFANSLGLLQFGPIECGLLFSCTPETMERRVLKRSKDSNRIDDNLETLHKRFSQFQKQTMPCVDHLRKENKVLEVIILPASPVDMSVLYKVC
jgi:adenylate kinase family enzyme